MLKYFKLSRNLVQRNRHEANLGDIPVGGHPGQHWPGSWIQRLSSQVGGAQRTRLQSF